MRPPASQAKAARRRPGQRRGRFRSDRGSQLLEFAAYFPLFMLVAVIAFESFLAFVAAERLEHAARSGARIAGTQGVDRAAGTARSALPDWLDDAEISVGSDGHAGYYTEVTVDFPLVFPASGLDLALTRRVEMPT